MNITNTAELREHYGEPSELVQRKVLPKLDIHCRNIRLFLISRGQPLHLVFLSCR